MSTWLIILVLSLVTVVPNYGYEYHDGFEDENCGEVPSHWITRPAADNLWSVGCQQGNRYYQIGQLSDEIQYSYLHVFERNPTFSGRFRGVESPDGYLAFLLRYNAEGSYVKLAYNWMEQRYEITEQEEANLPSVVRATQTEQLASGWHTFKVVARDSLVQFWVDDTLRLTSSEVMHRTFGRVGVETYRTVAHFDDITYLGETGRVNAGVVEYPLNIIDSSGRNLSQHLVVETLPDSSLLGVVATADEQIRTDRLMPLLLIRSYDRGLSWQNITLSTLQFMIADGDTIRHCCPQLLQLQSGALLSMGLTDKGEGQFVISSDGGNYWQKAGVIPELNRHAMMPGKLTQVTGGTIYGSLQRTLYASEDNGATWTKVDSFPLYDAPTRYVSVQEMQLIELPDQTFKIYARDGRPGAKTLAMGRAAKGKWNDLNNEINTTSFVSPKNAFNVQRDPYHLNRYYMFWTYNDRRDEPSVNNLPRTRLALAVSYDGAQSWQYAMDVEEWGYPSGGFQYKDNRYANLALHVGPQYLYLTAKRRNPIGKVKHADTQVWFTRVDKSKITPYEQFPGTHY